MHSWLSLTAERGAGFISCWLCVPFIIGRGLKGLQGWFLHSLCFSLLYVQPASWCKSPCCVKSEGADIKPSARR